MNTTGNTDHRDTIKVRNFLEHIPRSIRGHVVAVLGELFGTFSFIFFAFGGTHVANATSNYNADGQINTTTTSKSPEQLLYISLSFGFSLAVNAWVYARISGGLFNPAVTLGMWLIRKITFVRMILLGVTQCVGAIAAAYVVKVIFAGTLNVDTTPSKTTTVAQAVIIEMLLTAQLVFTIFMLAAEKHQGNFIAPVGIGLSLFIAELVGVFWTGGSLNPARSLAPCVATYSFTKTHWIYWVGPLAGSILAVLIRAVVVALEYETSDSTPDAPEPERVFTPDPAMYDSEKEAATLHHVPSTGHYSLPEVAELGKTRGQGYGQAASNAFDYSAPGSSHDHVPETSERPVGHATGHVLSAEQYGGAAPRFATGAAVSRGRYEPNMYTTDVTGTAHDGRVHHASAQPIIVAEPRKVV